MVAVSWRSTTMISLTCYLSTTTHPCINMRARSKSHLQRTGQGSVNPRHDAQSSHNNLARTVPPDRRTSSTTEQSTRCLPRFPRRFERNLLSNTFSQLARVMFTMLYKASIPLHGIRQMSPASSWSSLVALLHTTSE